MVDSLRKGADVTSTTEAVSGSAARWGPLWGARAADWALSEDQQVPNYEDALARAGFQPGQSVLDVGCGVGAFLRLVAERGGRPHGIDASEALLDIARSRLPDADLRHGDMEALPYDDDAFDLVTGFTSFFFADDIVVALREAGRVAKPGAAVVINVWGPPAGQHPRGGGGKNPAPLPPPPPPTRRPSPTTPSPACWRTSRLGPVSSLRRRSTPRGRTCSRMPIPSG